METFIDIIRRELAGKPDYIVSIPPELLRYFTPADVPDGVRLTLGSYAGNQIFWDGEFMKHGPELVAIVKTGDASEFWGWYVPQTNLEDAYQHARKIEREVYHRK